MALSKLCILAVCRTMSTSLISFSDFLSSPKVHHQAFLFPDWSLMLLISQDWKLCCLPQELIFLISSSISLLVCMGTRKHSGQTSGYEICDISQILTAENRLSTGTVLVSAWVLCVDIPGKARTLGCNIAAVTQVVGAGPCQQAVQGRRTNSLPCPPVSVQGLAQGTAGVGAHTQRNGHHPPLLQSGKKGTAFQEGRDFPGRHHDLRHIPVASPRPGQACSTPASDLPCN